MDTVALCKYVQVPGVVLMEHSGLCLFQFIIAVDNGESRGFLTSITAAGIPSLPTR